MRALIRLFAAWITLSLAVGLGQIALAAPPASSGFLVIAPDRGYLGNEEVRTAWEEFRSGSLTRLVFISLAQDDEGEVKRRLEGALNELRREGARDVVVIPLVLSEADPHLEKARALLANTGLRIAPVLGRDPLAGQILEDRARALAEGSHDGRGARLVVVGFGATSPEEAEAMARDLRALASEVRETLHLAEPAVAVFYHGQAPDTVKEPGNRLAETTILKAIEEPESRALVVPFHLGFKHTGSMQLGRKLESLIGTRPVAYDGRGLLPDPLVARWLRKVASLYVPVRREDLGIVVMPHGSGEYHNAPILAALEPLRQKYNLEVAFGMADVETLQAAIDRVEARGVKRIRVLRLYDISHSLKADTEFVLGLSNVRSPMNHGLKGRPSRVRSGALLSTGGGFDDHPLIAEVLLERVLEVSREPARETVILIAHGAGKDEDDRFWVAQMEKQAELIRARAPAKFRAIKVATVREDWPEKRDQAVAEVRRMIDEARKDGGRALVISDRIAGAGPYRRMLAGLDYVLNGRGVAPHPNLTRWVEEQIETWIGTELAVGDSGTASRK